MAIADPKEQCQTSRRIDFASLSFHCGTIRKLQNCFDRIIGVAESIDETCVFQEQGRSPHYQRVFNSTLNWRLEFTPPDSGDRNQGLALLSLPGSAFWTQSQVDQAVMLRKLIELPAFRHFTRMDFQNTELEPDWDADRVYDAVDAGEIWVGGYSSWDPMGGMDFHRKAPDGRSIYWGKPRAARRFVTYDKGKDARWKTPAIRDEVRLYREWARAYGEELVRSLRAARTSAEMEAQVQELVASALTKHGQYWTLNGADPQGDKNWKRKAEPADWFAKRIGSKCKNVSRKPRPIRDLESVTAYGVQQYGRYFALWAHEHAALSGDGLDAAYKLLQARFEGRLKDSDIEAIYDLSAPGEKERARKHYDELKNLVSVMNEQDWGHSVGAPPEEGE